MKILLAALMILLSAHASGCADAHAQTPQSIVVDFPAVVNTEGAGCSAGQQCAFTVRLSQQPTSNVAVLMTKNPTGKVLAFPSPIGFTPTSYSTPQNVLVQGLQDIDALDENVTITLTSTDGAPAVNVYAIVIDDDHP